jgi:hypothetical protein
MIEAILELIFSIVIEMVLGSSCAIRDTGKTQASPTLARWPKTLCAAI